MPKRIIQSELCNVCRHKPVCNFTSCNDFTKLEDCRCDELTTDNRVLMEKLKDAKEHLQQALADIKLKSTDFAAKCGQYECSIADAISRLEDIG